jgi:hypothetical protein
MQDETRNWYCPRPPGSGNCGLMCQPNSCSMIFIDQILVSRGADAVLSESELPLMQGQIARRWCICRKKDFECPEACVWKAYPEDLVAGATEA